MAGLDIKLSNIENEDSAALAEMTGAIDGNTVPSFQATLEEIKTKGIQRLVLDMSKIKYVNSTGLGSLVKYADTFKSSGGGMALIKVPAKVKIVIEMLGLNAFFDICGDLDAALSALANGAGAGGGGGDAGAGAGGAVEEPKKTSGPVLPPPVEPSKPQPSVEPATGGPKPSGGGFPTVVDCQGCGVQLELPSQGNWKCPRCYTFVSATPDGSHRFSHPEKPIPLELSLTATQDCGEGLVHLVTSVCSQAFNGQKLQDLRVAVHEVAQVMQQSVYNNNPQGIYHVSIERQPGRVQIRFSDSGATIDQGMAGRFFPNASRSMSEFECRPHPSGGNTIRLVQAG